MLSILTLNIWNYEGPWEQRLPLIREWIRLLDPDLIALQEVLMGPKFDQAAILFEGLEYYRDYASRMDYWNDSSLKVGNLLASRWPVVDREEVDLPTEGLADGRVLLSTDIESPHGILSLSTTHLTAGLHRGHVREKQIQKIGQTVIRRRPRNGFPLILCGDFNAPPDSSEIRHLKGRQVLDGTSVFLYDAWEMAAEDTPGYTFARENTYLKDRPASVRLDYVFVGERTAEGAGRIEKCYRVCDLPRRGVFPSDHFGVYVELSTQ